ncbi:MAG TPA: ATP-binding protein [Smithellaceae bacterium]|nr:ATP-binding protein [Smithellaceae bacterium]
MDLINFNPWWRTGKVPSSLSGRKRKVFSELLPYLETRQILLLTGLRRVGKTTLLFQLIEELLQRGVQPYRIFYYSFDEARYNFDELLKTYQTDVLKSDLTDNATYFFFDEIQKLPDWSSQIKILYDLHPQVKIFLSGSARIPAWRSARESLAGRFFDIVIRPLDFDEFLSFQSVAIDPEREDIFENDIKHHFGNYLKTGGFIEAFNFEDMILRKYIRESILERVLFVDMPMAFGLASPELLLKLLTIIAARPGLYLDYKNMANDLKIDQRTMSNYIGYLEYGLFLNKLYNYSPNLLTSEKKIKKVYLSNSAFTMALEPSVDFSLLMEQFFVNLIEPRFFLRTPRNEEIDMIDTKNTAPLPVEIKMRKDVTARDIKFIFSFLDKNKLKRGVAVTLNTEGILKKNEVVVEAVPYWKYWTIKKKVGLL